MTTNTMPTAPETVLDWERIEAGHRAVDALNDIIGELRGLLEHDPEALPQLRAALGTFLGPDQPINPEDGIVVHRTVLRTLTVETLGDDIAVCDRWADERADRLPMWLTPRTADDLADALHAAAAAARQDGRIVLD